VNPGFKRHTDDVIATVPKDRLLVFRASDGWKPLCAFLDVPVPDAPYPSVNSRADFQARLSGTGIASPDVVSLATMRAALD
jgi:hypothetical protein